MKAICGDAEDAIAGELAPRRIEEVGRWNVRRTSSSSCHGISSKPKGFSVSGSMMRPRLRASAFFVSKFAAMTSMKSHGSMRSPRGDAAALVLVLLSHDMASLVEGVGSTTDMIR